MVKAKMNLYLNISSNVSEVIRSVLNFLFFFLQDFTSTKKQKTAYSEQN